MAGDWIKFELSTFEKTEVYQVADLAGIDEDAAIGKLLRVWAWFDQQTENGNAPSVSKRLVDRLCGVNGFCDCMIKAGWMIEYSEGDLPFVALPNFDRHNGKTAKNRALTAKRVALHKVNATLTQGALPREEKRILESKDLVADESATGEDDLFSEEPIQVPKPKAKAKPKVDYEEIMRSYNELCAGKGKLIGCDTMNAERKRLIDKALELKISGEKPFQEYGIEYWRAYFSICPNDTHWCGVNDRGWRADFTFVLKEKNIIAALEKNNG